MVIKLSLAVLPLISKSFRFGSVVSLVLFFVKFCPSSCPESYEWLIRVSLLNYDGNTRHKQSFGNSILKV